MHGIPYWGETTFEDMRKLENTPAFASVPEDLQGCTDLFSLFHTLAKNGYLLKIGDFYTWCQDIKFNYRDKVIFAPYYTYSTFPIDTKLRHKHLDLLDAERGVTLLHYAFQLRLHCLLCPALGYKNMRLTVCKPPTLELYTFDVSEYPLIEKDLSIKELYDAYLDASYYDEAWDLVDYTNKYHWIRREHGLNKEYQLRATRDLPVYAVNNMYATEACQRIYNYRDIVVNDLNTIRALFNFNLNMDLLYWERRYNFEAYLLLSMLAEKEFVETEFNKKFKLLGKSERWLEYDGYNCGFPLYLKHYYTVKDTMSKLSYEKYLTFKNISDIVEV